MAAGPGNELGAAGRGNLRASHADRELVIETVKAAFVQGRLDRDEFDLRVGQTLVSRTYADLAALTADPPPGWLWLFHAWLDQRASRQSEQGCPQRDEIIRGPWGADPLEAT